MQLSHSLSSFPSCGDSYGWPHGPHPHAPAVPADDQFQQSLAAASPAPQVLESGLEAAIMQLPELESAVLQPNLPPNSAGLAPQDFPQWTEGSQQPLPEESAGLASQDIPQWIEQIQAPLPEDPAGLAAQNYLHHFQEQQQPLPDASAVSAGPAQTDFSDHFIPAEQPLPDGLASFTEHACADWQCEQLAIGVSAGQDQNWGQHFNNCSAAMPQATMNNRPQQVSFFVFEDSNRSRACGILDGPKCLIS